MEGQTAEADASASAGAGGRSEREKPGHSRATDPDPDRAKRRAHYASLQYSTSTSIITPPDGSAATSPKTGKGTDTNALRSLRYSVLRGELDAVQQALTAQTLKVDDVLDPKTQQRALHLAASKGRDQIVQLLLEHNADASAVDGGGKTASEVAIEKGFTVISNNLQAFVRSQQSAQAIQEKMKGKEGTASSSAAALHPALNWRKNSANDKNFMSLPMGASLSMFQEQGDSPPPLLEPRSSSAAAPQAAAHSSMEEAAEAAQAPQRHSTAGDMSALFRSLPVGKSLAGEG